MTKIPKPTVISERSVKNTKRIPVPHPMTYCDDWAFQVPLPAFMDALDLGAAERMYEQILSDGTKRRVTRSFWSVGNPPSYAFKEGDVFHSPQPDPAPWSRQIEQITHTIQVKKISRDDAGSEVVAVEIHYHRGSRVETRKLSQTELGELLQFGKL